MSSSFAWSRAAAIGRKEVYHILRDPFTLALALAMPVVMVLLNGVAIEFNVRNVGLAVSDEDKSQSSRRLIDTFASSGYFVIHGVESPQAAVRRVGDETYRASLVIPPRFEKDLLAGRTAGAQILLDGADNSTVGPVSGYVGAIQTLAAKRLADFDPPKPYELRTRFLFNPELNSHWFVIPGLTVVVMSILSIFLTSLTVAREWENGSMELLLSTPVEPLEIIVGKLAPYGALGIIGLASVYILGRTVFGVPFVGSLFVFGLGSVLFLVTYLAQGLLISVVTRNQAVSMQFAVLSGMLPANLLSGFVFPIASMPRFFWYFTMLLPARWFMTICRDTFLKGASLAELGWGFVALGASSAAMVMFAKRRFKRDLEP